MSGDCHERRIPWTASIEWLSAGLRRLRAHVCAHQRARAQQRGDTGQLDPGGGGDEAREDSEALTGQCSAPLAVGSGWARELEEDLLLRLREAGLRGRQCGRERVPGPTEGPWVRRIPTEWRAQENYWVCGGVDTPAAPSRWPRAASGSFLHLEDSASTSQSVLIEAAAVPAAAVSLGLTEARRDTQRRKALHGAPGGPGRSSAAKL